MAPSVVSLMVNDTVSVVHSFSGKVKREVDVEPFFALHLSIDVTEVCEEVL